MSLQHYRPNEKGTLEPRKPAGDWRADLQSPRWGSRSRGGKIVPLANPEMNPTPTIRSVLFWVVLAALTFVLLVAGYGSGFWR